MLAATADDGQVEYHLGHGTVSGSKPRTLGSGASWRRQGGEPAGGSIGTANPASSRL